MGKTARAPSIAARVAVASRVAAAFCDRSIEVYSTQAFQTVRNLIEGKPVGERIEVPVVFHHAKFLFVPTATPK